MRVIYAAGLVVAAALGGALALAAPRSSAA
jgi:hypothetical protein